MSVFFNRIVEFIRIRLASCLSFIFIESKLVGTDTLVYPRDFLIFEIANNFVKKILIYWTC